MDFNTFFEEANERSLAKAELVAGYFGVWAAALLATGSQPLCYIEFCAGPGRYEDGTESTPLLVLRQAIEWPLLAGRLVAVFNDVEAEYVAGLRQAIDALPGIGTLRHRPVVTNQAMGIELANQLDELGDLPRLVFADPWGFTPFTAQLFAKVFGQWSADLIFLFNYNRINMALGHAAQEPVLAQLFGTANLYRLLAEIRHLRPEQREARVMEALSARLAALGGPFVLPFRICHLDGTRTSYYVVYASRNSLGYALMRNTMAVQSTTPGAREHAMEEMKGSFAPARPQVRSWLVPVFVNEP